MKKLLFAFLFCFVTLHAQEETLIGDGEVEHGGFGAPVIRFTSIKNEGGVLVGGRGGWIINHSFVIGGGGYALVNNIEADISVFGRNPLLQFGYGGLELEYIYNSDELIHFTAYLLVGAGSVTYREQWDDDGWDWEDWNFDHDQFFVAEPAVNCELNVASFCRLNVGVSYRIVSGIKLDDLKNDDFAGPSANITIKFGGF